MSVEFCRFCARFPTLWTYGTHPYFVLSYRQKENILTPQQNNILKGLPQKPSEIFHNRTLKTE